MRKEIENLLTSTNLEDVKLGIIILIQEEPDSEYLNYTLDEDKYGGLPSYGGLPWSLYRLIKENLGLDEVWYNDFYKFLEKGNYFKHFKNANKRIKR